MTAFASISQAPSDVSTPGAIVEMGLRAGSRTASGNVNAGLVVCKDSGKCKVPASAANCAPNSLLGVAIYQPLHTPASSSVDYVASETVPFARDGGVIVYAEEAMAETDTVYVRHTAKGGNTILGAIRNDPDEVLSGTTIVVNAAANGQIFFFNLDGVQFDITYTDASPTTPEAATAIAAAIDAHALFVASAATSTVTVTRADGALIDLRACDSDCTGLGSIADATCVAVPALSISKASTAAGGVRCALSFPTN